MSTGLETWNMNLLDIGPLYPFAGTEGLWFIIGLVTWILWHIIQCKIESNAYREEDQAYTNKELLEQAMQVSKAETLLEAMKDYGRDFDRQTHR